MAWSLINLPLLLLQLNVVWLDVVTYLHHHGYEKKVPWYRGEVGLPYIHTLHFNLENGKSKFCL